MMTTTTMTRPWILTSPSSRGIGLALTRHLLRTTSLPVVATARTDVEATRESILEGFCSGGEEGEEEAGSAGGRLTVLRLDVTGE